MTPEKQTDLPLTSDPALASASGSMAIPSVKTLLAQMMAALDAGDSDKYWAAFEAVMKRHEEVIAEVTGPEND